MLCDHIDRLKMGIGGFLSAKWLVWEVAWEVSELSTKERLG